MNHLQKNKERIEKLKEIEDSWYIYQNELDKACFQPLSTWHGLWRSFGFN